MQGSTAFPEEQGSPQDYQGKDLSPKASSEDPEREAQQHTHFHGMHPGENSQAHCPALLCNRTGYQERKPGQSCQ